MPAGRSSKPPQPHVHTIIIDPAVDLNIPANFIRLLTEIQTCVGAKIVFVAASDVVTGEGESQTTRKVIKITLHRSQKLALGISGGRY